MITCCSGVSSVPISKGGRDTWENVVCACFHCNSRKGGRTPHQAGMPLLAVPFRPSWVEHLILSTGRALAGPADDPVELAPGDCLSYPGDEPHVFDALEPGTSAVLVSEQV